MGRTDTLWRRGSRFVGACALVVLVFGMLMPAPDIAEAQGSAAPLDFNAISTNGFGDCMNTYAWSMAWFKGRLYVGTNRGSFLGGLLQFLAIDPDFHCTGTDLGSDSAAEIWRYTPETNTWERVFQSPGDVPVPDQPGTFIARDNGFRDMLVYTEPDGTEALYVGGVIYLVANDTRQPRILRSTDGENFEAIPQDPGTVLGEVRDSIWPAGSSFRAMASYKGRFYVTVGSVFGEGVILEATDPAGGNDNFRQVSPPGLLAFELIPFNGYLYVGSGQDELFRGFDVLKTDATPNGTPYYDFVPVVTNGADGPYLLGPNNAVLSMEVFQGRLFVGGQTDLLRINPDDTWDLVVGTPRTTSNNGDLVPLSGLPQGFGNIFTGHLWRMEAHDDVLYVGTWDFAVFLRIFGIIGDWINLQGGFDLWKSEDGITWSEITHNGLDSKFNHGVRSLLSTPAGLFLGTTNPWDGTEVYRGLPSESAAPQMTLGLTSGSTQALGSAPLPVPQLLEAEMQGGGAVLSWEPLPEATHYRISRSAQTPSQELGVTELPPDSWLADEYAEVGTTNETYFRDSAVEAGHRYTYYVQAAGEAGQLSAASNVVMAPSFAPAVTFYQARVTLMDLWRRQKIKSFWVGLRISAYLSLARYETSIGKLARARSFLEALHREMLENPGGELEPWVAEDLAVMVAKLLRRIDLAESGVIPIDSLMSPSR
jgi:hypothetical protein